MSSSHDLISYWSSSSTKSSRKKMKVKNASGRVNHSQTHSIPGGNRTLPPTPVIWSRYDARKSTGPEKNELIRNLPFITYLVQYETSMLRCKNVNKNIFVQNFQPSATFLKSGIWSNENELYNGIRVVVFVWRWSCILYRKTTMRWVEDDWGLFRRREIVSRILG